MSDMVPQGWEVKKIGESKVVVLDGDRGSEYPKERDFSQNGYCLFLSAKNVTQNGFVFSDCSFISREKDEKLRKGRLDKFDIVITTRGTVGNIAFFDDSVSYEKIRINSGMAILRNEEKSISHIFLYHLLNSILIKNQIDFFTFGSAQPQLTIGTLNSIYLRIPPLAEQKKIASILTSVDQVIEKTESEISKLQDLKKGMMQQLLTQGIG
ncbi:type I restriction endonuclease subunit S, partial [Candidatus Poribacteria bacterium]|nr:type I restriction endonuclease subunit S [Candidatus Poribacteria bacterium]